MVDTKFYCNFHNGFTSYLTQNDLAFDLYRVKGNSTTSKNKFGVIDNDKRLIFTEKYFIMVNEAILFPQNS